MLSDRTLSKALAGMSAFLFLSGCQRAPSVNLVGSFFPAWLLCIAAGIVLSIGVHFFLVRLRIDKEIKPAVVVYPCLAASCCFTLWLIFFS